MLYTTLQLKSFRIHFARAVGSYGMLAKLLEEEASEMGPSRDRDMELIRVRTRVLKELSVSSYYPMQAFDKLSWIHFSRSLRRWLPRNYPNHCQPF